MLGLLGLLGAVFAGVLADSILTSGAKDEENEQDIEAEDEAEADLTDEPAPSLLSLIALSGPEAAATSVEPEADTAFGPDEETDSSDTPPEPPVDQRLIGEDGDDILTGDGGDDSVEGGAGGDLLGGRDGNDTLHGGGGDDHLHGDEGDDSLFGDDGDDVMDGEAGNDILVGGQGNDYLAGHDGKELILGEAGDDRLLGGGGQDTLDGGAGDDWLCGGEGDDSLTGGAGTDTIDGNDGDDTLWGFDDDAPDAEMDFLNGGRGDDTLHIGASDYAFGDEGADRFVLSDWAAGEDSFAHISDFNPAEDEILVLYDAEAYPDPQLSLEDAGEDDVTVLLNGLPLAHIAGGSGLDVASLRLVPSEAFRAVA
jgi:hypothetical protein